MAVKVQHRPGGSIGKINPLCDFTSLAVTKWLRREILGRISTSYSQNQRKVRGGLENRPRKDEQLQKLRSHLSQSGQGGTAGNPSCLTFLPLFVRAQIDAENSVNPPRSSWHCQDWFMEGPSPVVTLFPFFLICTSVPFVPSQWHGCVSLETYVSLAKQTVVFACGCCGRDLPAIPHTHFLLPGKSAGVFPRLSDT